MGTTYQIAVCSVLDGNQTPVRTSTGVWQVTYNGENRPVRWVRGSTVVTMDFDSMGRRTFSRETENDVPVASARFFYDGYLMIQQLDHDSPHAVQKEFIWDPTESVATKPLVFRPNGMDSTFLTHDGNKNVADVIRAAPYNDSVGHYEYAPFGAVTSAVGTRAADNPFRFSSEYADDTLGLDYYNKDKSKKGTKNTALEKSLRKYFESNFKGHLFRVEGLLKFQLCECVDGELRYVDQDDVKDAEEVNFDVMYDVDWYLNEVLSKQKDVEKEMLRQMFIKVRSVANGK